MRLHPLESQAVDSFDRCKRVLLPICIAATTALTPICARHSEDDYGGCNGFDEHFFILSDLIGHWRCADDSRAILCIHQIFQSTGQWPERCTTKSVAQRTLPIARRKLDFFKCIFMIYRAPSQMWHQTDGTKRTNKQTWLRTCNQYDVFWLERQREKEKQCRTQNHVSVLK